MPVSDGMILGEAALGPEHFNAPHFQDGFTSLPSLPSASDPNNTGKFDDEHWLIGKSLEGGWADGPELSGIVLNKEEQLYTSTRRPSPDGWSPFETSSEGLIIRAREIPNTPTMLAWGIGKRYGEQVANGSNGYGGQDLFLSDFASAADVPGTEGVDWFAESDGRIRFDRYQLRWQSGILSTGNGRASIDQGEVEFVARVPAGSIWSSIASVTEQSCAFAALWLIEQFIVGTGRNQQPLANGLTHYPYTGGNLINELDPGEFGGFDPYTNHNSRHVYDGFPLSLISDGEAKYIAGLNMQQEFVRIKCHITPEKIGMAIGPADGVCRYTRIMPTPRAFKETRREYELVSPYSDQVVFDGGLEVERGDLMIDGQIMTRRMMALMNVAMDGRWLRERMIWERDTILNRGYTYPAYATQDGLLTCQMTVRSISMRALTEAKFLKADGGFFEPHKGGTTGGGTTTIPEVSTSKAPDTGGGVRYSPSLGAGVHTWTLEDPEKVGAGTWVHDFGGDASIIGSDTGPQLKLYISPVAEDTAREVSFVPVATPVTPDPVITYTPITGLYTIE